MNHILSMTLLLANQGVLGLRLNFLVPHLTFPLDMPAFTWKC